jgi:hypothetical protein
MIQKLATMHSDVLLITTNNTLTTSYRPVAEPKTTDVTTQFSIGVETQPHIMRNNKLKMVWDGLIYHTILVTAWRDLKNHKNCQSERPVSKMRLKPKTSLIQSRCTNHSYATSSVKQLYPPS